MCISSLALCSVAVAIAHGDSKLTDSPEIPLLSLPPLQLSDDLDIDVSKLAARIADQAIAPPERFHYEHLSGVFEFTTESAVGTSKQVSISQTVKEIAPTELSLKWMESRDLLERDWQFNSDWSAQESKDVDQAEHNAIEPDKQQWIAVDFHEGGRGQLSRSQVAIDEVVLPSFPVLPIDFVFPAETYIAVDDTESSNSPLTDGFRETLVFTPRVQLLRDFLITEPPLFETPISGAALVPPAPSPFFPPTQQGPTNDICEIRELYPPNPRRPATFQRLDAFCLSTDPGDSRRFIADHGANDGNPYGRSLILGAIQVSDDPVQTATSVRIQLEATTQDVRAFEQGHDQSLASWANAVERCLISNPRLYTIDADGNQEPILFNGREGRIELNRNGRPFCPA